MAEVGSTGTVTARYLRGINLIAREQDSANQYYQFNAHGDVTQRANAWGNVLKAYRYDAFGNEQSPEKLDSNPFRYCEEYFDRETGEIYLRARYYNPAIGRFGAKDLARSGLNWYTYCGGNPIFFIDPLGLAYRTEGDKVDMYTSRKYKDPHKAIKYDKHSNAIWVDEQENEINLYVRVQVLNNPNEDAKWNEKYHGSALEGIADSWSGEYGEKKVNVLIMDIKDKSILEKGQKYISIYLKQDDENKQGSYVNLGGKDWDPTSNQGNMVLYNNNPFMKTYNETKFRATAGHEFGHVLGIADGYNMTGGRWKSWGPTPSIMNDQFAVSGAQAVDYGKILEAQSNGKWQTW